MKANTQKAAALSDASKDHKLKPSSAHLGTSGAAALMIDLESKAREAALEVFIASVQTRFQTRFPDISYKSHQFDFKQPSGQSDNMGRRLTQQDVHRTKIQISRPNLVEGALAALHPSFAVAARAILVDQVLQNKTKDTDKLESGLRFFAYLIPPSDRRCPEVC
jgi:hypothetical protein